jgi:hypothetical protein
MGYGLLGSVFRVLDPILDTVDPMHNKVQEWTTGSKDTEKQSPYFETIAPMIVDAFLPGWGSALGAVDGASTGNWTKAGLSALGSYAGFAGQGAGAASGASEGLQASEGLTASQGLQASDGLSSTSGYAAGDLGSGVSGAGQYSLGHSGDYSNAFSATNPSFASSGNTLSLGNAPLSSMESAGASGGGLLANQSTGVNGAMANQFASGGSSVAPSQYAGLGDKFNSTANLSSGQIAANQPWYSKVDGKMVKDTAKVYGSYEKQLAAAEQQKAQREAQISNQFRQQLASFGGMDSGGQSRPAASVSQSSPYAQFNGGFNPKKYGADVRKGLL